MAQISWQEIFRKHVYRQIEYKKFRFKSLIRFKKRWKVLYLP